MKVALYLKNLDEEYQISVFKGIRAEAVKMGIDIYCIQGGLPLMDIQLPADGILLLSSVLYTQDLDPALPMVPVRYASIPALSIGIKQPHIPSITIRTRDSMESLMEHLIVHHGYRNLLYIGGPVGHRDNTLREHVFRETIRAHKHKIPELKDTVANGGFSESSAIQIMKNYIRDHKDTPLDAVVAANDNMAIGVLKVLHTSPNKKWNACAVTGFDDIPQARLEIPSLTTVHQPLHKLGQLAVRTIHDMITENSIPEILHIESNLFIRNSCGCHSIKRDSIPVMDVQLERIQYQSIRFEQYLRNVSSFGQQLTTATTMYELISLLQGFLNNNDVPTFFLLLSSHKNMDVSDEVELLYKRFKNEEQIYADNPVKISLSSFFGEDFRSKSSAPSSPCIYTLRSGSDKLGLIVYETDDNAHPHICSAAIFIANTVKRLMILEDEKERSRMLEHEVQLRTSDLVEMNRQLKKEAQKRIEVEAEVLHISEMERLRFSLDLHDDICQRLAGISMFSKSLEPGADLGELSEMIDETLTRTRQYAHDSFPVELDSLGLDKAFDGLCHSIEKQTGCICTYTWDMPENIKLTSSQEINLYRIIQEALHNTVKHSKATRVNISVNYKNSTLIVRVSDNGKGIRLAADDASLSKRKAHLGIGLKSMEYRSHQIGARYIFKSSETSGTVVEIRLPL